jgi:hypothetical protein
MAADTPSEQELEVGTGSLWEEAGIKGPQVAQAGSPALRTFWFGAKER